MARDECQRTGVYLLLGDDIDSLGQPPLYVGEGDVVRSRLYTHNRDDSKDWFEQVVILTSKDSNLTKAHVRYLEARFIAIASETGRSTPKNGTAPAPLSLPEADIADMEFFIEQAQILLPVLGVNAFRSTRISSRSTAPAAASPSDLAPDFRLTVKDADATANEVDGEFVVREGSIAHLEWTGDARSYERLHAQLVADGTLLLTDDGLGRRFARDVVFKSPSAAAAVVLGRNSNGRTEWKVGESRQSYGDWQDGLVDAAESPQPVLPPTAVTGEPEVASSED
jgi:hypothetical protein